MSASTLPPPSIWCPQSKVVLAGLRTKWRPVADATTNVVTRVPPAGCKIAWGWAVYLGQRLQLLDYDDCKGLLKNAAVNVSHVRI